MDSARFRSGLYCSSLEQLSVTRSLAFAKRDCLFIGDLINTGRQDAQTSVVNKLTVGSCLTSQIDPFCEAQLLRTPRSVSGILDLRTIRDSRLE
jgi:hypothetical protein